MTSHLRLGVNIDHVATLRNARGGTDPDPVRAAMVIARAGADGVTAHLREDRRHITDDDIHRLGIEIQLPLNMEMAPTDEMVKIALGKRPHAVCIVPERREELTTEGGLDVDAGRSHLKRIISQLSEVGIQVSLFIDPDTHQIDAALAVGAPSIELHTGEYCNANLHHRREELTRLQHGAAYAREIGLECHAGHGLTLDNVGPVALIPEIVELNIGHSIVGDAIFVGLETGIRRMRVAIDQFRQTAGTPE